MTDEVKKKKNEKTDETKLKSKKQCERNSPDATREIRRMRTIITPSRRILLETFGYASRSFRDRIN